MRPQSDQAMSLASGIGGGLAGIGILVMALSPFAVPGLVLTAAAVAILALPLVALALAAALVAGPFLAIRWLWRQLARHSIRRHEPTRAGALRLSKITR
jgi:hypothetical protein